MSVTLTGARVLRPDGWDDGAITIEGGQIRDGTARRRIDLSGCLILPGIVDIHGDGFERHMAPRRGALREAHWGVIAAEAELAANGITTAVLAQFYSWEGGMRGPEFARHMCASLSAAARALSTDIRLQLRLETHMIDSFADALSLIDTHAIRYVVFNDHLPHDRLATGRTPKRLTGQALKSGRSPETHFRIMQGLHARSPEVPQAVRDLASALLQRNVVLGSHDDPDAETRAIWRGRGVAVSEFPETREAAQAAIDAGEPVILGAPNVVRGASHAGNVSAQELIADGLVTALASDYHYPAPRRAAMLISETGLLTLDKAWALVSGNPAAVLGLADRGRLAPGARADMVVLEAETRRVLATMAQGQLTYVTGAAGARLLG